MADTQTFANQSPAVQQMFTSAFGDNAAANWTTQHASQLAAQGGTPTSPPVPGVPGIDPNLAAQNALSAQQQASMSWAQLLGFYDPSAPQNLPANQQTLAAMQALGFMNLPGQATPNMPTQGEQQVTGQYYDPASGQWKNTLAAGTAVGNINGTPTLEALQQQSNLSGLYNNAPTAAQLNLAGYVQGPNGQMLPTEQATQTYLGAIQNLLANNNSATPFTYLAQQRGLSNLLSPIASTLRGGIFGATGQTQGQLAAQPNMTVSQAAGNAQQKASNNVGDFFGQMLNYLYNSVPGDVHSQQTSALAGSSPMGVALPGAGSGHIPGAPLPPTQGGSTASMGNTGGFGAAAIPTGFGTSAQGMSMLSPTAQSAYQNLIQTAGGENPQDFAAGIKLAAPEFAKSAAGSIAGFGQM